MTSMPDESKLISEARDGNKDAFSELVRRHHSRVIAFCTSFLKNPFAAQDAAQDVFIKAYRGIGHFRGDSLFSTWLYTIARRHCLDLLRYENRRKTESWDSLIESYGERVESLLRSEPSPTESIENRDLVNRVLSLLSVSYKEALILRETQGLSYAEMARVLECSIDAVKARLKRARKEFVAVVRHLSAVPTVPKVGGAK